MNQKSAKIIKNKKNTEVTLLSAEKAENLYNIFMAEFKEKVEENNCILLNLIQPKIGEQLKKEGFEPAKKALFLSAPDYFICGFLKQETKEKEKNYPAICVVGFDMPDNFVPENKNEIITDLSRIPKLIKNTYRYNSIPVTEAKEFLRKYHIRFDDIHSFIASLDTDMTFELSYSGMNNQKKEEEYLVIHKPLEIDKEAFDKVVFIAKSYYADVDEISNATFNHTLTQIGVNYHDYNYMDITAFLKQFSDIFVIKATQGEYSKKYNIKIKILHDNLKNYKISPAFRSDLPPRVLPFEFDNYRKNLFNQYEKGQYDELRTTSCTTHALKNIFDYELWSILINAYLKESSYIDENEYVLTEWEKAIFVFDTQKMKKLLSDEEFLIKEKLLDIKDSLLRKLEEEQKPVTKPNALGTRFSEFLPKNSLLPKIIFAMGLEITKSEYKKTCFRSLALSYISDNNPDMLLKLWDNHGMYCDESSASQILSFCTEKRQISLIPRLYEYLSEENRQNSQVIMNYTVAKAVTEEFCTLLCNEVVFLFLKLPENSRKEALCTILTIFKENDRINDICIFSNTIILNAKNPDISPLTSAIYEFYLENKEETSDYLLKNADENNIDLCAFAELVFTKEQNKIWAEKRKETIEKSKNILSETKDADLTKKLLYTFSDEEFFLDEYINSLDIIYESEEKYQEIALRLSEEKLYNGILVLLKKGALSKYENTFWFNEILIKAFEAKLDYTNAISHTLKNLETLTQNSDEYYTYCNNLINTLYNLFFSSSEEASDFIEGENAQKLLEHTQQFATKADIVSYTSACVLAMLFILTEKHINASFMYNIVKDSLCDIQSYTTALEKINILLEENASLEVYENSSGLESIFDYALVTLPYNEFTALLKIGQRFTDLEDFEKKEVFYRNDSQKAEETTKKLHLHKMLICKYNDAEAWGTFSRNAYPQNDYDKAPHFFAVQLFMITQFYFEGFCLIQCISYFEDKSKESFPKNLLKNILILIKKKRALTEKFWKTFLGFAKSRNIFSDCEDSLLAEYYSEADKLKYTKELKKLILNQTGNLTAILSDFFEDEQITQNDKDEIFHLVINFLCNSGEDKITDHLGTLHEFTEKIQKYNLSKEEKILLLPWIKELIEKSTGKNRDGKFISTTRATLGAYPNSSYPFYSKENLTTGERMQIFTERYGNHLNLLRRWLKLFPTYSNARSLSDLYRHLPFEENEEKRQAVFEHMAEAISVMYENPGQKSDNLRDAKNLLSVYFVTVCKDDEDVSPALDAFIKKELCAENKEMQKNELLTHAAALASLHKANLPHSLRDKIIYATLSFFWDNVINDFINGKYDLSLAKNENLKAYLTKTEYSFFNRRLLQMLIYAKIIAYNAKASDEDEKIPYNGAEYYPEITALAGENCENEEYYQALVQLSEASIGSIPEITDYIKGLSKEEEKEFLICAADMIFDRSCDKALSAILSHLPSKHTKMAVYLLFTLQYSNKVFEKTELLIKESALISDEAMNALLSSEAFEHCTSFAEASYLRALRHYIKNEEEEAKNALPKRESCEDSSDEFLIKLDILENAIKTGTPLPEVKISNMPKLSFIKAEETKESFNELVMQFTTENLKIYSASDYISLAKQIYYHIINYDEKIDEFDDFIIKWGLYEESNISEINKKASILTELLDFAEEADKASVYEKIFFEKLKHFLTDSSNGIFSENSKKIQVFADKLCDIYINSELSGGIKEMVEKLVQINELNKLAKNKIPSKLSEISESAQALKTSYINNPLIDLSLNLIADYKKKFESEGRLEIEILNEDDLCSGSVYYIIKNTGKSKIDKPSVTSFLISGDEQSEKPIDTHSEEENIYIGGMLAFEDKIKDFFKEFSENEQFKIKIIASYSCDEEASTVIEEEKILTVRKETSLYNYIATDKMGKREELTDIYKMLCINSFVLLYGTNGTGKTTVMKALEYELDQKNTPDDIHIFPIYIGNNATGYTTHKVVEMILKQICYIDDSDPLCLYSRLTRYLRKKVRENVITESDMQEITDEYIKTTAYDKINEKEFSILTLKRILERIKVVFSIFDNLIKLSLCILWDAFETVVSSEELTNKENFKDLIDAFVKGAGERKVIHIVFAGSNKLLEVVKVKSENQDDWNFLFRDIMYAAKKIGNLSYYDYERIMNSDSLIDTEKIKFTPASLEYLYEYTRGHIKYSRLFAEKTLARLNGKYTRFVYPSDINISDISEAKELTIQILADISDEVITVGKQLAQKEQIKRCPISKAEIISTMSNIRNYRQFEVERALDILLARDFIEIINNDSYKFTSEVYMNIFLKHSYENKSDENKKNDDKLERAKDAMKYLMEFDTNIWYALLKDDSVGIENLLRLREPLTSVFKEKGLHLGDEAKNITNINADTVVTGNVSQTNIQNIRIESIANSVLSLSSLTSKDALNSEDAPLIEKCIGELPKLHLKTTSQSPASTEYDDLAIFDTDSYADELECGVKQALSKNAQDSQTLEEWANENADFLNENNVDAHRLLELPDDTKDCVLTAFYLYKLLKKVFTLSQNAQYETSADYSPVTVMLCKALERMLKKYHLPLYKDKNIWINEVKSFNTKTGVQGGVITFDHSTLGTFTTALLSMFDISYDNDPQASEKEDNMESFLKNTNADEKSWEGFTKKLTKLKPIRNRTAHTEPVSQKDCEKTFELLFKDEVLKNTIKYIKE